jgi:hypothetical protein
VNEGFPPQLFLFVSFCLVLGIAAFVHGLMSYRRGAHVASIATSPAGALAAGEVRLHGTIEPLVNTLVSPLQSEPAVWYRARIMEQGDDDREVFAEERATQFLLKDSTGQVRVIPRGARWEVPNAFDESTDLMGDAPPGLRRRNGASATVVTEPDHEAAIAALLTVRPPATGHDGEGEGGSLLGNALGRGGNRRRYTEARLSTGDEVTVLGYALPYGDLAAIPDGDLARPDGGDDPALVAELAEARAAGVLAPTAAAAWGNAAIPGFGIGKPERAPELDPEARPLPVADAAQAERADELFEVPAEDLVVSSGPDASLVVYAGDPVLAKAHHDQAFLIGMGGGLVAALSALALVLLVNSQI